MRLVLLFFIIILMIVSFSNCAFKYTLEDYDKYTTLTPIVVSEKVGVTIDSLERKQYNLFPGIENFNSAAFYEMPEGGYVVELITADGKYQVVNQDNNGIKIMCAYIDDYEKIQETKAELMKNRRVIKYIQNNKSIYEKITDPFESEWHIVDYDDLSLPITEDEIAKFNRKTNTKIYGGSCCLSSCLVGGLFTAMAAMDEGYGGDSNSAVVGAVSGGAAIASSLVGAQMGKAIDNRETIDAIKQARKPKKIE